MRVSPVLSRHGAPFPTRLCLARKFGRNATTAQRDETLPAADAGGRAAPSVPVGPRRSRLRLRNYWLSLVVYLAYC